MTSLFTRSDDLLTPDDKKIIIQIEFFMKTITEFFLDAYKENLRNILHLETYLEFEYNTLSVLDNIIVPKGDEPKDSYHSRVINNFKRLHDDIDCPLKLDFWHTIIDETEKVFSSLPTEDIYPNLAGKIEEILSSFTPNHIDQEKLATIMKKKQEHMEAQELLDMEKQRIKEEIELFKRKIGIEFDYDDNFEVIKIHRQKSPVPALRHSIIYTKIDEKMTPFALDNGKDGKALGEGGFGRVKKCQNIETGEWFALKISHSPYTDKELEILKNLKHFFGERDRRETSKYYHVQTLFQGKDLSKHQESLDVLEIAKKIIQKVVTFHELGFLHRDIKPENLIWDSDLKILSLCDFGLSCKIEESYAQHGTGTPGFIAPEIETAKNPVHYNLKTEAYAVGVTLRELFQSEREIPEPYRTICDRLCEIDPEARMALKEAMELLESPDLKLRR